MNTNVEVFFYVAGFALSVLAIGLCFAYSSGRERLGKPWQENRDE